MEFERRVAIYDPATHLPKHLNFATFTMHIKFHNISTPFPSIICLIRITYTQYVTEIE